MIQQCGLGSGEITFDVQVAVPADEHGGQADERVQHCDQLGHAGHLDDLGAPQTDRGTDGHGADQQREAHGFDVAGECQRDRRYQGDGHSGDAESVTGPGCFMLGQSGQREDEQ